MSKNVWETVLEFLLARGLLFFSLWLKNYILILVWPGGRGKAKCTGTEALCRPYGP